MISGSSIFQTAGYASTVVGLVLGPWTLHPMFSHIVDPQEAERFGGFIGAELLSMECLTPTTVRHEYFAKCIGVGSLLLDPTTGISFGHVSAERATEYILGNEFAELVGGRGEMLTAVYDQSLSRGREREGL